MHLTRDVRYAYAGYHHCPSHCRLRVYQTAQAVLALCTEVPDNPGTSITNRTEALAAAVWREEQRPACFVWVEHYPANPLRREAFRVVRFQQPQPGIFTHPTWYPLRAAILDILLAADPPAAALAPWHSLPAPPG